MTGLSESIGEFCAAPWVPAAEKVEALVRPVRLPSNLRDNWSRNNHVRLQFGPNIPHTLTLPYTTQQAPMKLKLAEAVYNPMRWRWDSYSGRGGSAKNKCMVRVFLCHEPDIRTTRQPLFIFGPVKSLENLGFS